MRHSKTIRLTVLCSLLLWIVGCHPPQFDQHVKCDDGYEANKVFVYSSTVFPGFLAISWQGPNYDPQHWRQTITGLWRSGEGCTIDAAH